MADEPPPHLDKADAEQHGFGRKRRRGEVPRRQRFGYVQRKVDNPQRKVLRGKMLASRREEPRLGLPHGSQLPLEAGGFAFCAGAGGNFPDSTQLPPASISAIVIFIFVNIKINVSWVSTIEK